MCVCVSNPPIQSIKKEGNFQVQTIISKNVYFGQKRFIYLQILPLLKEGHFVGKCFFFLVGTGSNNKWKVTHDSSPLNYTYTFPLQSDGLWNCTGLILAIIYRVT